MAERASSLATAPRLAPLAALDATVAITAHALRAAIPDIDLVGSGPR